MDDGKPRFYRLPDGSYSNPKVSLDGVRKLGTTIPALGAVAGHPVLGGRAYGLGLVLLRYYFGKDWLDRHIIDEPADGYFGRALGDERGANLVQHRVRTLVELLLNLQPAPGIASPMAQIAGGQIESGIAELEVAQLLYLRLIPFKFVNANGVAGQSFDLELTMHDGTRVAADTKCKLETNLYSPRSFRNSLEDARRRNLPKDQPGIIFVKIPNEWIELGSPSIAILNEIRRFLFNTRRIISVQIYTSKDIFGFDEFDYALDLWEFPNDSHDYGDGLEWRLTSLGVAGGLPAPKWWRLVELCSAQPD